MNVYSIYDGQAQYFLPPFNAETDGVAKRNFIVSLGDSFPFRADFILYRIGHFDSDEGLLIGEPTPAVVMNGISIDDSYAPMATSNIVPRKGEGS